MRRISIHGPWKHLYCFGVSFHVHDGRVERIVLNIWNRVIVVKIR